MANILWHSNAPWVSTGYGVQTDIFAPLLKETLGHDVTLSAFWGLQGSILRHRGLTVLPGYSDDYGNDILPAHAKFTEADLVITLMDVWVLLPEITSKLPWFPWTPIDHSPVPHPVRAALASGGTPIAMSKFGQTELQNAGFFEAMYVPHSPHHALFKNYNREEDRREMGWDDKFVFGMVAANKGYPCRKSFPEVMTAYKQLASEYDDVHLHIHSDVIAPWGTNLFRMAEGIGVPEGRISYADHYKTILGFSHEYMGALFTALDCLVNPSWGEGFGVPIVEAQACGTPVIVTDHTSMKELCFYGTLVDGQLHYSNQGAYQKIPDVSDIYEAMKYRYLQGRDEEQSQAIKATIANNYHPDIVTEQFWKPTIEKALEIAGEQTEN